MEVPPIENAEPTPNSSDVEVPHVQDDPVPQLSDANGYHLLSNFGSLVFIFSKQYLCLIWLIPRKLDSVRNYFLVTLRWG